MATTANGQGYWEVASDGGIFSFNAPFYGALAGWPLRQPVTGMTATPSGHGYWIVTGDGAVFPFGDAKGYGTLSNLQLNSPIKSLIAGPGGKGYWLYAADGGVFSFGSARFHGSTGTSTSTRRSSAWPRRRPAAATGWLRPTAGSSRSATRSSSARPGAMRLNAPVVGMARTGAGTGYWLGAADGGVFTFGSAHFKGSAAGLIPADRHGVQVVGMPDGNGYRMLALKNLPDVGLMSMGATGAAVTDVQNRLVGDELLAAGRSTACSTTTCSRPSTRSRRRTGCRAPARSTRRRRPGSAPQPGPAPARPRAR